MYCSHKKPANSCILSHSKFVGKNKIANCNLQQFMISLCTYYCMCKTNLVLVHSNHRFRRKETQKFVIIQIRYLCAFSYISDHLLASIHYIHGKTRYKIFIRKIYKINITFVLTLKSVDKIYKNIGLAKVTK